jgi:serine phosphatase RsbU (regulator of sigma subunit)
LVLKEPIRVDYTQLAEAVFLLSILAIVINRFARTRREQDRVNSEIEAARAVQQAIIPKALPQIPGLQIQTAYHPAQEVGGDFFQVLSMPSGTTLVIIGDVSGKGLPAALTVSLALGTLRTLVDYIVSPGEILAGLNRRLHGRGTGFTTCLAVSVSPDTTTLTVANAGHLSPYLNGSELPTEANLPLGLDPNATFAETCFALHPGDHLTLLTDGVPEAAENRTLLGFERTAELSRGSADFIADTARRFGQTDDITVLTVQVLNAAARLAGDPTARQLSA